VTDRRPEQWDDRRWRCPPTAQLHSTHVDSRALAERAIRSISSQIFGRWRLRSVRVCAEKSLLKVAAPLSVLSAPMYIESVHVRSSHGAPARFRFVLFF
jgi:hypothetical protein